MGSFKGTIKELQPKVLVNGNSLSDLDLNIFLQILRKCGGAEIVGKKATVTGKGKPSNIWEVNSSINLDITEAK